MAANNSFSPFLQAMRNIFTQLDITISSCYSWGNPLNKR